MQLRFDGTFGFPGGLMNKGEDVATGLNRELGEEIGWDPTVNAITMKDYFSTQVKLTILHSIQAYLRWSHFENWYTFFRGMVILENRQKYFRQMVCISHMANLTV